RGTSELFRVANGAWTAYPGSAGWGLTAIAASDDDRLFAIAAGKIRRVDGNELKEAPCPDLTATAISADGADRLYAVNPAGVLYRGIGTSCAPIATPASVRTVAAIEGRVIVLDQGGTLWRRRGEGDWRVLPPVRKYRAGMRPYKSTPTQVAVSAYSTWIIDDE